MLPNQTTDLTLYAQWGVTTGLIGSVTTHYTFFYDQRPTKETQKYFPQVLPIELLVV